MKRCLIALLLLTLATVAQAAPETVAVTYPFAPANEAALREVLDAHWATLVKLDLVTGPHHLYRGHGFFLEVFTWKDASIPDDAPPAVTAYWTRMHELTAGAKGSLKIQQVERVSP